MPSRKPGEGSVRRTATPRGAGARWEIRCRSASHTRRIGTYLGRALHNGDVVALYGDLGTGKTTLVRGIATGLEIPAERVSSPTFALIQTYMGRLPMVHADLYRLDDPRQLHDLGLSEYWDGHWVVAVEWAEKAAAELPPDRLDVRLEHHSPATRDAVFLARGPRAARLLTRTRRASSAAPTPSARRRSRHKR